MAGPITLLAGTRLVRLSRIRHPRIARRAQHRDLNSRGVRALTGLNVALTQLVTGEFGVGHVQQRFETAAIGTIDGRAWSAMLTRRPTRVLDVSVKVEQIVTQTSDTSVTGVIANNFQLGSRL